MRCGRPALSRVEGSSVDRAVMLSHPRHLISTEQSGGADLTPANGHRRGRAFVGAVGVGTTQSDTSLDSSTGGHMRGGRERPAVWLVRLHTWACSGPERVRIPAASFAAALRDNRRIWLWAVSPASAHSWLYHATGERPVSGIFLIRSIINVDV